mmetsp:Transcript_62489/g.177467  ORF Transcript_62489/g.177467 Transcript_62489/m.177467 type:complete len:279 (+) Transcript_62489:118-954(+)
MSACGRADWAKVLQELDEDSHSPGRRGQRRSKDQFGPDSSSGSLSGSVISGTSGGPGRKDDRKWTEALVVKNTFLEVREEEDASSAAGSRASSDPTHSRSHSRSSAQSANGGNSMHTSDAGHASEESGSGTPAKSGSRAPSLGEGSREAPVGEWSVGALLHAEGKCQPCRFFARPGCENGSSCKYCHIHPEMRQRPCKSKRARAKQALKSLDGEFTKPEEMEQVAQQLASKSKYMNMLVTRKLQNIANQAGSSSTDEGGPEPLPRPSVGTSRPGIISL